MTTAQVRSTPDTDNWRDASWLAPESITSTNILYGWQKFRLAPTESEQAA